MLMTEKRPRRISLIKTDVEGSELDVLLSLEVRHWKLVDQVVIETARSPGKLSGTNICPFRDVDRPCHDSLPLESFSTQTKEGVTNEQSSDLDAIFNLLRNHGFKTSVETDPGHGADTGCLLIFASRYD